MFVVNAKSSYDVEAEQNVVEITTERWLDGTGWKKHKDFIYTGSNGDWTELNFKRFECVGYVNFLNTMVQKNVEVLRKIAQLLTDTVVNDWNWSTYVRLMNSLTILDPTFEPPHINLKCRWQRELLETICTEWATMVISTCYNPIRLGRYAKEVELLTW